MEDVNVDGKWDSYFVCIDTKFPAQKILMTLEVEMKFLKLRSRKNKELIIPTFCLKSTNPFSFYLQRQVNAS